MKDFTSGLSRLGVEHTYLAKPGFAPIEFSGQFQPGSTTVQGVDSQVVSALLLASAHVNGVTNIQVVNPGELPWVALTERWLPGSVKMTYQKQQLRYTVVGSSQKPAFTYQVPGDFSSIAYIFVAAGLVGAKLSIKGLSWQDLQGDKRCIDIVQSMDQAGAIVRTEDGVEVLGKIQLVSNQTIDVNDCIDMVTIVAVIACYAEGQTTITGAAISRQKESDRLLTMVAELRKMGAHIHMHEDGLHIIGGPLHGADLDSWQDHRVAMALAVAAMAANGSSVIRGAHCVAKSYPGFFQDLQRLGAGLERI
jgi:3-phosphoshikimate 1-carboxyvinyltransferase